MLGRSLCLCRTRSTASSFTPPGPSSACPLPSLQAPGVLLLCPVPRELCPPGSPQSKPFAHRHPSLVSSAWALSGMGTVCDLLPGLMRSPASCPGVCTCGCGCACVHTHIHMRMNFVVHTLDGKFHREVRCPGLTLCCVWGNAWMYVCAAYMTRVFVCSLMGLLCFRGCDCVGE